MKKPPQSLKSTVVRRQPSAPPGNPSLSEQLQTLTPTPTKVKLNPHNLQTAYLKRLCGQSVHVKCLDGERLGGIFKSFDQYFFTLEVNSEEILFFKHGISYLKPAPIAATQPSIYA